MNTPSTEEESPSSWEYDVPEDISLSTLLDRIRDSAATHLFLNITRHRTLRKDGALRRMVVSAASEVGKKVTFSFRGGELQTDTSSPPRTTVKRSGYSGKKKAVPRSRAHSPRDIPVSVIAPSPHETEKGSSHVRLSSTGKRIAFFFCFLAGFFVTAVILFLAPYARVELVPITEPVTTDITLRALPGLLNPDTTQLAIPLHVLEISEPFSSTFPVTNGVEKGEKATGTVDIVNHALLEQQIKGGTRLETDAGIIVRMTESAFVLPNSSRSVPVVADKGGTAGNLAAGTLLRFAALPKTTDALLFARVATSLSGGTDNRVMTLSDDDIQKASEKAVEQVTPALEKKLRDTAQGDVVSAPELLRITTEQVVSQEKSGAEVSEFHLQGVLHGRLLTIQKDHLQTLVGNLLAAKAGDGKTLARPVSLDTLHITKVDWEKMTVDLSLHVDTILETALDTPSLQKALIGRTPENATEYVKALPGMKDGSVTVGPFWISRVPSLAHNIRIHKQGP